MSAWSNLKAAIAEIIRPNNNQEITGQNLQTVLNNLISSLGQYATFGGIAEPETNPGAPDGRVFYLASTAGAYPNFSGINLGIGEVAFLEWDPDTLRWTKKSSGFASQEAVTEALDRHKAMSQSEYDALPEKDDDTFYYLYEE